MKLSTYAMKLRKRYKTRTGTSFLCIINDEVLADLNHSTTSMKLKREYRHYNYIVYNYIRVQLEGCITIKSLLYHKYRIDKNLSLEAHKFKTELLENMIRDFKDKEEEKK